MDTTSPAVSAPRRPNARGQGERLREEIISAAVQKLGDLADDEALSLRAVARAVSVSPTSVYLYFPDRDTLVLAAMQRCHEEMLQAADQAEAAHEDPAARLRARILAQAAWAQEHPGLYKVMHESKVSRRPGMPSLRINEPDLPWPPLAEQTDRFLTKLAGLAPPAAR